MTSEVPVLWDVVEEHVDEAAFLLETWERAVESPRTSLHVLRRTVERRLMAHLDALAVGGPPVAERLLWPAMAGDSAFQVAAAALALLVDRDAGARDTMLNMLRNPEHQASHAGLARAFKVAGTPDVDEPLKLQLYACDEPALQQTLLDILAARGVDPGPILSVLLTKPEPPLLAIALRAAANSSDRGRYRNTVEALLAHADVRVRGAAIRTGLIWNLRAAWKECPSAARAGVAEAMLALAQLGNAGDLAPLEDALRTPRAMQMALYALGFSGRREAVEACVRHLGDEDSQVAKLALEAVMATTGQALDTAPFAKPRDDEGEGGGEADDELPPLAEDLAVDLTPHALDELPEPDAQTIGRWWSEHQSTLAAGQRYVRGLPLSKASVAMAITDGPLRRVPALAAEIAIRTGGRVQLSALRVGGWNAALPDDGITFHREPAWI